MGKTSCRYVINALGKGGETYYTHCKDKAEVKTSKKIQWQAEGKSPKTQTT